MMNHTCTTSNLIGLVLTLLVVMPIGATITTTTFGTRMKLMASVPQGVPPTIKKSTFRASCKQGTSQGPPHLFIEKNSSKATTATVASHYVPLQPIGTDINIFIDREEEQRNQLQKNYPFIKKEKKEKNYPTSVDPDSSFLKKKSSTGDHNDASSKIVGQIPTHIFVLSHHDDTHVPPLKLTGINLQLQATFASLADPDFFPPNKPPNKRSTKRASSMGSSINTALTNMDKTPTHTTRIKTVVDHDDAHVLSKTTGSAGTKLILLIDRQDDKDVTKEREKKRRKNNNKIESSEGEVVPRKDATLLQRWCNVGASLTLRGNITTCCLMGGVIVVLALVVLLMMVRTTSVPHLCSSVRHLHRRRLGNYNLWHCSRRTLSITLDLD